MPLVEKLTPWAANRTACNSTRVMSGSCPISSTKNATNGSGLPLPLRGPDGSGSRGAPSRTFLPHRAAVARLGSSVLPAAAHRPQSINVLNRTRRAIESTFAIKHPPTQDESQNTPYANPQRFNRQGGRFRGRMTPQPGFPKYVTDLALCFSRFVIYFSMLGGTGGGNVASPKGCGF